MTNNNDADEDKEILAYFSAASSDETADVSNLEIQTGELKKLPDCAPLATLGEPIDVELALEDIWQDWKGATDGMLAACSKFVLMEKMVREQDLEYFRGSLPFPSHLSKARKIAAEVGDRFASSEIRSKLPPSFEYIYELALLDRTKFDAAVQSNRIWSSMTGDDVAVLKGKTSRGKQSGVVLFKLLRDEPLTDADAIVFRHAICEICAPLFIRAVEPKSRGKRAPKVAVTQ
jgi:hypothetical protein